MYERKFPRHRVTTVLCEPPIPGTHWAAMFDDYDMDGLIGEGPTEAAAIDALREKWLEASDE